MPLAAGSVQVIYRTPVGTMKERMLGRTEESSIGIASAERPFSFDGNGSAFQLACEAKRIDLAFRFDPMMAYTAQTSIHSRIRLLRSAGLPTVPEIGSIQA